MSSAFFSAVLAMFITAPLRNTPFLDLVIFRQEKAMTI